MNSVFLTGGTGFVGKSILKNNSGNIIFKLYKRNDEIIIKENTVIHLAGIAHDTVNRVNETLYKEVNVTLTCQLFDAFIESDATKFIFVSSVKAVADSVNGTLLEDIIPQPNTLYGKSKLEAEKYILSAKYTSNKKVYILRPCMIHGPENKGNLNLLFKFVNKNIPWPLASFKNSRSYCSIDNVCFVLKELIERDDIPPGIYNISDDQPVSTNDLITWIAESKKKNPRFVYLPKTIIKILSKLGDIFNLPLNSERLKKLTENYVVSNQKIKGVIGKPLPLKSKEGFLLTFQSFINT